MTEDILIAGMTVLMMLTVSLSWYWSQRGDHAHEEAEKMLDEANDILAESKKLWELPDYKG